ncbi:hypothetical protein [Nocardia asteroides]|uniref:Secreted protein n=1 Tax=Nocardia asteroides NBRC 15531 TaxID=1110697 RepID=U5E335_NOCAS|nr:hypothetical protein [Nocardia asteroides]UGT50131.1 hypothetical protein LT345_05955 [Nocardia asteroides]GAD81842.1 hypothetical protein NCAST_05_02790 [Nocardia asteroides NBRC 15531]
MNPVVQQVLTMVGVLLGAGTTFAFATWTERSRWRRAEQSKWDNSRLTAYTEFAHALKSYALISQRMAAARGFPNAGQPMDLDEGLVALVEADSEKSLKWEVVLLLGSTDAVAAARSWNKAVWELGYVAMGTDMSHDEYVRRYEEAGRLRNDFYACARADLGVRGGELPPGNRAWLPPGVQVTRGALPGPVRTAEPPPSL